jgi:phage gpG-like protein
MSRLVDVDVDVSQLIKIIDGYASRAKSTPMSTVGVALSNAIDDEIESEGRGSWPGLAPSTLKRHPKRAGGQLLQDIGLLANIQQSEGPDWAEAKSPAPYAGYHVTGTRYMEPRNFVGFPLGPVLEEIADIILEDIVL